MLAGLEKLQKKHHAIREIRALGLMIGVELDSADLAKSVFQQMLEQRVILNRTDETVLRFLPPFIIRKQHVDEVLKALDQALSKNAVQLAGMAQRRNK
jgi:acetylornithine aminotransferase/acetylornithine/N-succinyldiaminopimelate aminotransferase